MTADMLWTLWLCSLAAAGSWAFGEWGRALGRRGL